MSHPCSPRHWRLDPQPGWSRGTRLVSVLLGQFTLLQQDPKAWLVSTQSSLMAT